MQYNFEVLDFIPMGAFVLDAGYRVLFWNRCMENWTRRPASALLGTDIRSHYPQLGAPKIAARLEGVFQGGPPVIFSAQLHRQIIPTPLPGGRLRLQNTMVNAVHTDQGFLALFTLQDVTEISRRLEQYIALRNHALSEVDERRKAEAEIKEREALYRAIFEKIRAAKMIVDPYTGDIVDANTAACYFYGYPYPQLLRMNAGQIFHLPQDELLARMQRVVHEDSGFFELQLRLADGDFKDVEVHAAPIEVRGQTLLYCTINDVTERKLAEAGLRSSEQKFRLIFDMAGDMILLHDLEGRILDANRQAWEILAGSKERLLGLGVLDLEAENGGAAVRQGLQALQQRSAVAFETTLRCASGELLPVEAKARRLELNDSPAVLSILRDISERKKIEALREDVERITRHDLKNPLGAILGLPEILLLADNLSQEQRDMLQVIQDAGYSMLNIINLSLDLYKMESGNYVPEPTRVNLLRLVAKIFAELRELLQAKRLRPRLDYRNGGEPLAALGEEMLCYSILSNLIGNAAEAAPEDSELLVSLSGRDTTVHVAIHNQGAVPEGIRERFFEKYVTHGKEKGTGLGTYSARLMVQVQGGDIGFESSEAEGTTVWVDLPRAGDV